MGRRHQHFHRDDGSTSIRSFSPRDLLRYVLEVVFPLLEVGFEKFCRDGALLLLAKGFDIEGRFGDGYDKGIEPLNGSC